MSINYEAIRELQQHIGAANKAKGFHDDRGLLRIIGKVGERHYWMSRLSLITTEVAEAIEEVRKGRAINETYYSGGQPLEPGSLTEDDAVDDFGNPRKPEGVPSELADVVIRALDLAEEASIDLASMVEEKLAFNATRAFKHGKKA